MVNMIIYIYVIILIYIYMYIYVYIYMYVDPDTTKFGFLSRVLFNKEAGRTCLLIGGDRPK